MPPLHPPGALMADRRTVRVHARVSPAELADWRAKSAAVGVPLSDLLRQAMARTRTWTAAAAEVEHKYTSGVIAWAPEDRPTEAQIEAVLDKFEDTAWAGLEPDRYSWTAVEHRERGGGVHVHVLAARCDLETGRSLNIAPPGWQQTFDPLRDGFQPRARLEPAGRPGAHQDAAARTQRLRRSGTAAGRAGGRGEPARLDPGLPGAVRRERRRAEPRRRRLRPGGGRP